MTDLKLAAEFPESNEAEWLLLVEKALKGRPFDTLKTKTLAGTVIEPLYGRAAGRSVIAGRPARAPWLVSQRIDLPDPEAAHDQLMDDLNNGAPGLSLVFEGAIGDYGYALKSDEASLAAILKGVLFDQGIGIDLDFAPQTRAVTEIVAKLVEASGADLAEVTLRFGFNPLAILAAHGALPKPFSEIAPGLAAHVKELSQRGFKGPFLSADGRVIHAAGGSEIQELAFVLANAVAYLRMLEEAGIDLDAARGYISFHLAADQSQFPTMAKFRALRKLWARIEQASGLTPKPIHIKAETAWRMMARRDAYGNMVRTTIACAAAALGGADAVSVLPYTAALGVPRDHARRVARNTQLILIEESNLHQVADPSAGSGGFEAMTDAFAKAAWRLFQEIEKAGGAYEALKAGLIQKAVGETKALRDKAVATRKEAMIGVSDFPDLDEETIDIDPPREIEYRAETEVAPLRPHRLSEPFEALRDRSDAAFARSGKRPAIFLATLGKPADFTARATFARSFFAAGGIAPLLPEKPATTASGEPVTFDIGSLVAEFRASGQQMVCLCSSDAVYDELAAEAAKALKAAGARQLYLAGKPKESEALKEAGIDDFIFQGCDTLGTLKTAQALIAAE